MLYSIKSIAYIFNWKDNKSEKYSEYILLSERKKSMADEIAILKVKVVGLREKTINKEILETQAKTILNLAKPQEIVIIK